MDRQYTTWHITFGTYGTRLHGGVRPTVKRAQNQPGEPFVERNQSHERAARVRMRAEPVLLSRVQQHHVESALPVLCDRGGWRLRAFAAGPDHVHVLCDAPCEVHAQQIRTLLKRWLTQSLDQRWTHPAGGTWWAEGGSTKPVKGEAYCENARRYIESQRASLCEPPRAPASRTVPGPVNPRSSSSPT